MKKYTIETLMQRMYNGTLKNNKFYDTIGVVIVEDVEPYVMEGKTLTQTRHNAHMDIDKDGSGDYLDFTKTKFKELGIVRIETSTDGEVVTKIVA